MKPGGIIAGLVLALVAHFLAVAMAGAGHGWITPFWASFILWIVLPLTFANETPFGRYRKSTKRYLLGLVAAGVAADAALLWATIDEGTQYFWTAIDMATSFSVLWLSIWASWQLLVLNALTKDQSGEIL